MACKSNLKPDYLVKTKVWQFTRLHCKRVSVLGGLRKPKTSGVHSIQDGATYLVTRSQLRNKRSILSLPEELLLHLLKELHIKDLLSVRSVSTDSGLVC